MRRALPAAAMTIAGVAAILTFRTRELPSPGSDGAGQVGSTTTSAVVGSTTTSVGTPGDQTVTGPVIGTEYGPVQVQVVISAGRLQDVIALQLPGEDPHSDRINTLAEPILRGRALAAQSASIDIVSGATFTWAGYTRSLQAALDAAGL